MASFRIRAEFDLDVLDEGSAREIARQFLIAQIDDATMKGEEIRTGTQTPAEMFDGVLDSPKALASLMATSVITRGASLTQAVRCSSLTVEHLDP
ncbi:hypothetical protein [Arthrobacter sp. B1805]|uniref:hypothetical protein n=1 Tax=Arthrobacter sp. B1805 TaxID=2058892 RepID=UPI0011B03EE6|nr:hypothetical protein [Arthrobacter sp. B1805]